VLTGYVASRGGEDQETADGEVPQASQRHRDPASGVSALRGGCRLPCRVRPACPPRPCQLDLPSPTREPILPVPNSGSQAIVDRPAMMATTHTHPDTATLVNEARWLCVHLRSVALEAHDNFERIVAKVGSTERIVAWLEATADADGVEPSSTSDHRPGAIRGRGPRLADGTRSSPSGPDLARR
jgi:hypothetical protein